MADAAAKRSIDEVKADLAGFLADLDVEKVERYDEEGSWGFTMTFGNYPILIDNEKGDPYCVVIFQVTLPEGEPVEKLNALYAKDDYKSLAAIFAAFSSPLTGFSRIFEGEKVAGFTVSKYIYPFHPGFSIRELDGALQAVVSAGAMGVMFLKSLIGEWEEEERAEKELGKSEPGPMYE
ncbi:MAG TPA: hypothetical protein VKO45_04555 [Methanomicrobiales archaeon]|nr:hypothetical protein [Methanomicrobiales archaeon]